MITGSFSLSNPVESDGLQLAMVLVYAVSMAAWSIWRMAQHRPCNTATGRYRFYNVTIIIIYYYSKKLSGPFETTRDYDGKTTTHVHRLEGPFCVETGGFIIFCFLPSGQTRSSTEGRKQLRMTDGVRNGNEPKPFSTPAPCERHVRISDTESKGEEKNCSLCP